MPGRGQWKRVKKPKSHACEGCGKLFVYPRAALSCRKTCQAQKPMHDLPPDTTVLELINSLNHRLNEFEKERTAMQLRITSLEEKSARGTYQMRTGKPRFDFGKWDEHLFMSSLDGACQQGSDIRFSQDQMSRFGLERSWKFNLINFQVFLNFDVSSKFGHKS